MKVTIMTSLFTKRDVDVERRHKRVGELRLKGYKCRNFLDTLWKFHTIFFVVENM
jgi:hypothetical protein